VNLWLVLDGELEMALKIGGFPLAWRELKCGFSIPGR
jgi:hypothetical protein